VVVSAMGADPYPVIYRRSHRSITFRCERCRLQWTVTSKTARGTVGNVQKVATK
jgi:hypothetical protein